MCEAFAENNTLSFSVLSKREKLTGMCVMCVCDMCVSVCVCVCVCVCACVCVYVCVCFFFFFLNEQTCMNM